MTLPDSSITISLISFCSLINSTLELSKTQGSTENLSVLIRHEINNRMRSFLAYFCSMCIRPAKNISCILNYNDLHSKTNSKIRFVVSAILGCENHSLNTAASESTRNDYAICTGKPLFCISISFNLF